MASEGRGGFGWGLVLGGLVGLLAGAYLVSGPGRGGVEVIRGRTVELTGRTGDLRSRAERAAERARAAVNDPGNPFGKALQEGLSAARRHRGELELGPRPGPGQDGAPPGTEA